MVKNQAEGDIEQKFGAQNRVTHLSIRKFIVYSKKHTFGGLQYRWKQPQSYKPTTATSEYPQTPH
jgi:hypothetical protein